MPIEEERSGIRNRNVLKMKSERDLDIVNSKEHDAKQASNEEKRTCSYYKT
jgi:hypothetical protein